MYIRIAAAGWWILNPYDLKIMASKSRLFLLVLVKAALLMGPG